MKICEIPNSMYTALNGCMSLVLNFKYTFYNVNCIDNRLLQVQALYHHPSLGQSIDLTLVRLDLMSHQPRDLPHHDGERGKLLDSFCDYSAHNNPAGDSNPDHWDMGLYVSG